MITYCSNDISNKYGNNIHIVEIGFLQHEYVPNTYLYKVETNNVDLIEPNKLVIDSNDENNIIVRFKNNNEILIDKKIEKLNLIQHKKNEMRDGGFNVNGIHFDSDMAARLAYTELSMRLQMDPLFTTEWKATEGFWVTMDAALFSQVYTAGAQHITTCFTWQKTKELEVLNSNTIEELNSIIIG